MSTGSRTDGVTRLFLASASGALLIATGACIRGGPDATRGVPPRAPQSVVGWELLLDMQPSPDSALTEDEVSLWSSARTAIESANLEDGYRLAAQLLHSRPQLAVARSLLGLCELRAGFFDAAQAHFDAAFVLSANPESRAIARAGAVLAHLNAGRDQAAYENLEALHEVDSEHAVVDAFRTQLRTSLAERWIREGRKHGESQPRRAADAFERALVYAPEAVDLRLELVAAYRAAGADARALEAAANAVSQQADYLPALKLYAELLIENGQPEEALSIYRTAAAIAPLDTVVAEQVDRLTRFEHPRVPLSRLARIHESGSLSREDLSAVLLDALGEQLASAHRSGVIVTDVEDSWARHFILESLALGLQRARPNRIFEPQARVSSSELRHAFRRAAQWMGAICSHHRAASQVQSVLRELPRDTNQVTGKLAFETAQRLAAITENCNRRAGVPRSEHNP